MYLYSIYVLVGHKMWFSAFCFYFEGHFISKKKKCGKMRMLNHGDENLVNILEHKHLVMWIFLYAYINGE